MQLRCQALDPGFPPAEHAVWYHNGLQLKDHTSALLKVKKAMAASAGNYTCQPKNKAGLAVLAGSNELTTADQAAAPASASVQLEVHSPPKFVRALEKFTGKSLTCLFSFELGPVLKNFDQ